MIQSGREQMMDEFAGVYTKRLFKRILVILLNIDSFGKLYDVPGAFCVDTLERKFMVH